jgi:DNA-binding GntR family transcriptional regulator
MKGSLTSVPQSRGDTAYRMLKDAILSNDLVPGAPVSEEEWARNLGMSRTPVREALNRLEQERLVRRVPNHGVFVADLSIDDFLEICEVRSLLEGNACRLAASHASEADLARFEAEFKQLAVSIPTDEDVRRANEVDRAFHMFILDAAGNRQVVSIIAHLNDMITRLRFALTPSRYEDSLREHQQILDALKARDGEAAAAAMQSHMDQVSKSLHRIRSRQRIVPASMPPHDHGAVGKNPGKLVVSKGR